MCLSDRIVNRLVDDYAADRRVYAGAMSRIVIVSGPPGAGRFRMP
jgi:hypothetical protein